MSRRNMDVALGAAKMNTKAGASKVSSLFAECKKRQGFFITTKHTKLHEDKDKKKSNKTSCPFVPFVVTSCFCSLLPALAMQLQGLPRTAGLSIVLFRKN